MDFFIKYLPKKLEIQHYILILVLGIASFLRLYNVSNTVQFLGDQGRDALVVARIFKNLDPVFIGPVTSVGNMYLGPLYYYFMVPFLMITYPSPMGTVYAIALLGILTVFLVYFVGKRFLDKNSALWGSVLFGLSAVVAQNTRFSWNPNPAPVVSLLMMYFTYQALKKNERYWILVTICFAVLIQLHYLTLLSGAGFGLIWIYQLVSRKQSVKKMFVSTIISAVILLISMTPLVLFDLKHDGLNKNAFINILTKEEAFSKKDIAQDSNPLVIFLIDLKNRCELVTTQISIGEHSRSLNFLFTIVILSTFVYVIYKKHKNKKDLSGELVLASFLFTGIFGLALYKQNIYDHYISYLFPVVFLTLGVVFNYFISKKIWGYLIIGIFLLYFAKFNYYHAKAILKSLGWTIADIQSVSKTIEDRVVPGEKYNIVLLNSTGDILGQNYRYFLTTSEKPPVSEDQFGEVDTLFIIDEERKVEKEVDSPVYEIVTFSNKIPHEVYYIPDGPEITVLRKNIK